MDQASNVPPEFATPNDDPAGGDKSRSTLDGVDRRVKVVVASIVAVLALVAAFGAGYLVKDDGSSQLDAAVAERDEAFEARDGLQVSTDEAEGSLAQCRDTVEGYGDFAAQFEDLDDDFAELAQAEWDWEAAPPGSPEEAQVEARINEILTHAVAQRDKMIQQIGALGAKAEACLPNET
jgi:hypothetical protein